MLRGLWPWPKWPMPRPALNASKCNQNFNMWFSSLLATLPLMNGAHSLQKSKVQISE